MSASRCRYEQGPCTFPESLRRHFRCQDGSCPEQVGRMCSRPESGETKPAIHETKPAAPEVGREEGETMAQGKAGTVLPVGECDRCGKTAKLGKSKHAPGMRLCVSCSVRAFKLSKQGLPLDQAGGSKGLRPPPAVVKAPATSKAKAPAPSTPAEPIAQGKPAPAPVAAPVVADHPQGRAVVLRFTCHEPQEVAALLIAARSMSCSIGLDG